MSTTYKLFKNKSTLQLVKDGKEISFEELQKAMNEFDNLYEVIEKLNNTINSLKLSNKEDKVKIDELEKERDMLLAELSKYQSGGSGSEEPDPVFDEVRAFPTAMGAGAYTTGGRGGIVTHVTNLNDSGEGSLRWALTDSYLKTQKRTIVLDISGIVQLNSDIIVDGAPVTLAGQTAPEGGITITGGKIRFFNDQVIVRYIKGRSTTNVDGVIQSNDGNNVIFDHITASHVESGEVAIGMTSNSKETLNKTIQNCLIHDSGLGIIAGDTTPPNDTHNETISIINNVFVNVGHRAPAKIGGAVRMDIVNNFVHNWFARLIRIDDWSYTLNHVGNYYSKGGRSVDLAHTAYYGTNNGEIYQNDNYLDPAYTGFEWTDFDQPRETEVPASSFVGTPFAYNNASTLDIKSNSQLKTQVLPFVGCYKYINDSGVVVEDRDSLDTLAISQAVNESQTETSAVVDYTITLGEIPTANNTRPEGFYNPAKSEHIPEVWFDANVPTGQTHNDIAPNGYTWLENYINQVDA